MNNTNGDVIDQGIINEILEKYCDFNAREIIKITINGVVSQLLVDIILILFNNAECLEIVKSNERPEKVDLELPFVENLSFGTIYLNQSVKAFTDFLKRLPDETTFKVDKLKINNECAKSYIELFNLLKKKKIA